MAKHIPIADAHCDFLYYMLNNGFGLNTSSPNQAVNLEYMRTGEAALQCFAAWIDPDSNTPANVQCNALIETYETMLNKHSDMLTPFYAGFDPHSSKIATILTIEGGEALMGDVDKLHTYYERGVRAMALTWNASNELGSPAMGIFNRGLTRFGKSVVREMESIGMAIDVAHLSDRGIDEILAITKAPIYSSHTNARQVSWHRRSLSDKHIKAIAEQGGIICVNFYPPQLAHTGQASTADVVKHILHIIKIGGIDSVALGSDFDGMSKYPADLKNWSDMPNLINALINAGLTKQEVAKIAYENLAGYLARFC